MSARVLRLQVPFAAEPTSPWAAPPEPRWSALPHRGPVPDPRPGPHTIPNPGRPADLGLRPLPPADLTGARALRESLRGLLARERAAAADFLVALADFDRRRGWEVLGHASLFAFLVRELGLSKGAASVRFNAARLIPRFPAVEAALRSGQLCLSSVGQLAAVLTPEREAELLPRFFGLSAREAKELVAELLPREAPPVRAVVTTISGPGVRTLCNRKHR